MDDLTTLHISLYLTIDIDDADVQMSLSDLGSAGCLVKIWNLRDHTTHKADFMLTQSPKPEGRIEGRMKEIGMEHR